MDKDNASGLFIHQMLDQIMLGNGSVIVPENINRMNDIAMQIYAKREGQLSDQEVSTLKELLMICNVLYNRTDLTVQAIEDGFYDILLEIYKQYDEHFQVGSAVVNLKDLLESDLDSKDKMASPAIYFFSDEKKDDIHEAIYKDLNRLTFVPHDLNKSSVTFQQSEGISKRTHNTTHNHPDLVGTLDKVKFVFNQEAIDAGVFEDPNVKILERDFFQDHIRKGIISPNQEIAVVCELKYDGISVEADCGLELESARTRGDTGIGEASDITPILQGYPFHRAGCMIGEEPLGVKFEAIMTKGNLYEFNRLREREYVNCRSAIVGLFGASDAGKYRDLITLIPLALDRNQLPDIKNRLEEIQFLNNVFQTDNQPLRFSYFEGTIPEVMYLIKAFHDEALLARSYLDFMFDGIVVSYVDEDIRSKLGRVNYINKYSVAVKFNPIEKQTFFRGYTFEVGKNGAVTPMIHYDPVEFLGTIHTKSTGSSLARFNSLALKEGDIISVKYVNDVMPYVSRLECQHNRDNTNPIVPFIDTCPVCGSKLVISDSGKTVMCPNQMCQARTVGRMSAMFQALNIKGFADANFKVLVDDGYDHLFKLKDLSLDYLIKKLGDANGRTFYQIIQSLLHDTWKDYVVIGALGFSGMAAKTWKGILERVRLDDIILSNDLPSLLSQNVPNIGPKRIQTIMDEIDFFMQDLTFISKGMNIERSYGKTNDSGIQIRFSGVRNQQLVELLSTIGFDIDDSGVTKNTKILIVPYNGFESGKTKKAQQYGATIISLEDFFKHSEELIGVQVGQF